TQHVDVRVTPKNIGAIALCHAPDDADDDTRVFALPVAQLPQSRPYLLLGVLADGAGVVEDHVRVVATFDGFVALGAELAHDELAVEHVHLAAERFEIDLALHGRTKSRAAGVAAVVTANACRANHTSRLLRGLAQV